MNSHLELRGLSKTAKWMQYMALYAEWLGTCPIFGYDTTQDPKVGLYRSLVGYGRRKRKT